MMTHPTTTRPRAFTIMEMMIAIAVASLLLFLVNQLFMDTTRAVQVGVRTGDILVESETIGEQFNRDADRMLGGRPDDLEWSEWSDDPPGFLVIVNRRVLDDGDAPPLLYRGQPRDETEDYEDNWPVTGGLSIPDADWPAPRSDMLMFVADTSGDDRPFRANTPQTDDQFHNVLESEHARIWYGHVKRTAADGSPDGNLGEPGTLNHRASDWMLGRHQLLLQPEGLTGSDIQTPESRWNMQLSPGPSGFPVTPVQYDGLTDVADEPLITGDDEEKSIIALLSGTESPSRSGGNYPARAELLFTDGGELENMHGNPTPETMDFQPWRIAHAHTILSQHVSDVVFEFAGDYETPDDEIDRYTTANGGEAIKWYTADEFVNDPDDSDFDPRRPATFAAPSEFTSTQSDPDGPYLMEVNDEYGLGGNAWYFLFRHDKPTTWPHMIRIRYRVHDPRGQVQSTVIDTDNDNKAYAIAGQWFEHVIRVPRP